MLGDEQAAGVPASERTLMPEDVQEQDDEELDELALDMGEGSSARAEDIVKRLQNQSFQGQPALVLPHEVETLATSLQTTEEGQALLERLREHAERNENVQLDQREVDMLTARPESSAVGPLREMTAVKFATLVARTRAGDHWPVHVGFKDVSYTVSVPQEDVGITTVASTLYKAISPIVRLFSGSGRVNLPILRNVSGTFEAGKSTLVLGPPGCGVSTLFKVLAGRIKSSAHGRVDGEMYYSGFTAKELHLRKMAAYVDQIDEHLGLMTVRETLEFAYACFGGPSMARKLISAAESEESGHATNEEVEVIRNQLEDYPNFIIDNLALTNAADTIVGNDMVRGVSGGEKKRVTSAEILTARRPLVFYDQISTGLDSAATYDICRRIVGVGKQLEQTPVVALLQPPPETYSLFDDVLILAAGRVVYHGAREDVLDYFESIGFECPNDRDIADFIQEVTTDERTRYQTRSDAPASAEALAKAWQASPFSQTQRAAIERRCTTQNKVDSPLRREIFASDRSVFANSCCSELSLVMKRQWQLVMRDPAFISARVMQAVVMGVAIGTIFLDINPVLPTSSTAVDFTPITQRYGIIFVTMLQCGLAGFAQVPVVLDQRPVYYKQSSSFFYRTINYVIAESVTVIPIAFVESAIIAVLVFWLSALVPWGENSQTGVSDAGAAFMKFLVSLFALNISFSSFLRALAAVSPTTAIGQTLSGVCVAACILYSGYILTADVQPVWFGWISWLSPIAWAFRSAVLAIFKSSAFTEEQQNFALDFFGFTTDETYYWAGILVLVGYALLDLLISWFVYAYIRFEGGGGRQSKVSPNAEATDNPDVLEAERASRSASAIAVSQTPQHLGRPKASDLEKQGSPESREMDTRLGNEHFIPVDLAFRDLRYAVQRKGDKRGEYSLELLKGITGYAEAGTLTALMGSSGAGKSTLLDVLALRKTGGKITGDVLVNGRPQEKISFSRIVGYVEQNDIHTVSATVEEALIFSAFLRQPKEVSREDKLRFVESVLTTLHLSDIRGFQIGRKTEGGLSVEQAKRLTIGVELASNPALIFADEPTSGLDATSARVVMDCLERIARAGRTVICTIHQPSKDIFTKFDRLLLLKRGGEMVYFGDLGHNSQDLLDYLYAIPGTPHMPNARYNPATYMLEAVGSSASNKVDNDYAQEYAKSELRKTNEARLEQVVKQNLEDRPEIHFDDRFASDFGTQMSQLFVRWGRAYNRTPSYNASRFIVSLFIALFFGFSFFGEGSQVTTTQQAQSQTGLLFMGSTFTSIVALQTSIPVLMDERTSFYREKAASTYSVAPMVIAITFWELVFVFAASVVFVVPFYFICGFWMDVTAFFSFFGVYVLLQSAISFLGHLFAVISPAEEVASVLGAVVFAFWGVTSGLMIAVDDIGLYWRWASWLSPMAWALRALTVSQLACTDSSPAGAPGCNVLEGTDQTAFEYIQQNFKYEADDFGPSIGYLAVFVVGYRIMTIFAYKYISWLKR